MSVSHVILFLIALTPSISYCQNTASKTIIAGDGPTAGQFPGGCSPFSPFNLPSPPNIPLPQNTIVFTYDDGPANETSELAIYLRSKQVPATFFVNGCRFSGHNGCVPAGTFSMSILDTIIANGHRVANHSESHILFTSNTLTDAVKLLELKSVQQLIDPYIKDGFHFFRPGNNCWDNNIDAVVKNSNDQQLTKLIGPFGYDSWGADWWCTTQLGLSPAVCALIYFRAFQSNRKGIIQMHDRNPNDIDGTYTLQLTKCLLEGLGSISCPYDPNVFVSNNVPVPTQTELPLFNSGYKFAPLDAIPGVVSGAGASFNPPTDVATGFSDVAGWNLARSYYSTIQMADVNGDGIPDICGRFSSGIVCSVGNSNLTFQATSLWLSAASNSQGYLPDEYGTTLQLGDIDKDGKSDACIRGVSGYYCFKSGGSSFSSNVTWSVPSLSDANGWNAHSSYYRSIRLGDINGDGFSDVCARSPTGIFCASGGTQGFGVWAKWSSGLDFSDSQGFRFHEYGATVQLADVSGDGKADSCVRGVYGIYCALSTGAGFTAATVWIDSMFSDYTGWKALSAYYGSIKFADINGDGKADVCGRAPTGIVCAVSNSASKRFEYPRYVSNLNFFDSWGWNAEQYGSTLMMRKVGTSGIQRSDICLRGISGVVCAFNNTTIP
jgi:peptidoglycan/xylan/chitin deacetylase (PgdA/CDA1 family)